MAQNKADIAEIKELTMATSLLSLKCLGIYLSSFGSLLNVVFSEVPPLVTAATIAIAFPARASDGIKIVSRPSRLVCDAQRRVAVQRRQVVTQSEGQRLGVGSDTGQMVARNGLDIDMRRDPPPHIASE